MKSLILSEREIGRRIYQIRGHRVMLDSDLAELYEVETGALKRAVRRNFARFPADFMFEVTPEEHKFLRCQIGILDVERGKYSKYPPFVFTEHGVSMLSAVLNSHRSVQVNIAIIRTFVRLRQLLESNQHLVDQLNALEEKYDHQFKIVFDAIRKLMELPAPPPIKEIKGLGR